MKIRGITFVTVVALLCFGSCDKAGNPASDQLVLPGTTWKLTQAQMHGGQYTDGAKTTVDSIVSDSLEIAELGNDFGYFNFITFLNTDSVKLFSNMVGHRFVMEYAKQDSFVFCNLRKDAQDSTGTNLVFKIAPDNCLILDYPGVFVSIRSNMNVAMNRVFESTLARDNYIAIFDSLYNGTGPADTVTYLSFEYTYTRQ